MWISISVLISDIDIGVDQYRVDIGDGVEIDVGVDVGVDIVDGVHVEMSKCPCRYRISVLMGMSISDIRFRCRCYLGRRYRISDIDVGVDGERAGRGASRQQQHIKSNKKAGEKMKHMSGCGHTRAERR